MTDLSSVSSSWPTSAYENRRPIEATATAVEADTAATARCRRGSARWTTRMIGRRVAVMSTHVYRAAAKPTEDRQRENRAIAVVDGRSLGAAPVAVNDGWERVEVG